MGNGNRELTAQTLMISILCNDGMYDGVDVVYGSTHNPIEMKLRDNWIIVAELLYVGCAK